MRAFPNGGTRFTYTLTVDARLQKQVVVGGRRFDVLLDVYNLSNRAAQVEENVFGGPGFRATTAVQPPLVARIGMRFTF